MQILIGLDGGGTGCRAQAALPDGRRGAVETGGPANIFTNPDAALHEIEKLLARCIEHAQAEVSAGVQPVIALGLAGAVEYGDTAHLMARLPYQNLTVLSDIDIAVMGAFPDREGVVMAVGTGSVVARKDARGLQRVGGHGLVLGDDGSGAWIGREALRRCLLAQDGLGVSGPLTRQLWARFGCASQIIRFGAEARPADFATLAPIVLEQAQAHCPVACAILDAACAYLRGALGYLQGGRIDLPVAPMGGLGPILLARMMQQGGAALTCTKPAGSALDGALWFARQHSESTAE